MGGCRDLPKAAGKLPKQKLSLAARDDSQATRPLWARLNEHKLSAKELFLHKTMLCLARSSRNSAGKLCRELSFDMIISADRFTWKCCVRILRNRKGLGFLLVRNHSFEHEESEEPCHGNITPSWSDSTKRTALSCCPDLEVNKEESGLKHVSLEKRMD